VLVELGLVEQRRQFFTPRSSRPGGVREVVAVHRAPAAGFDQII
jgi:hypothetical protein